MTIEKNNKITVGHFAIKLFNEENFQLIVCPEDYSSISNSPWQMLDSTMLSRGRGLLITREGNIPVANVFIKESE